MRERIFQRKKNDCFTAACATLLGLSYEEAPQAGPHGVDMAYRHYLYSGRIEVIQTDIDKWLKKNGYKWGPGSTYYSNLPEFYLGILDRGIEQHCVVMCGSEIWHDPAPHTLNAFEHGFRFDYGVTIEKRGRISKWLT